MNSEYIIDDLILYSAFCRNNFEVDNPSERIEFCLMQFLFVTHNSGDLFLNTEIIWNSNNALYNNGSCTKKYSFTMLAIK